MKHSIAVVILGITVAVAQNATPKFTAVSVKPNGYFRTENGLFSLSGSTLCSYSSSKVGDETKCYLLTNSQWRPTAVNRRPSPRVEYLDFAPCDPLNQLNIAIQHKELAALLPTSAALKQVIQQEHIAFVVYSDTPDDRVRYSVRLAALQEAGGKWSLRNESPVGADGSFCGMRVIDERKGAVVLVYLNEPAASADYYSIRSFRFYWD